MKKFLVVLMVTLSIFSFAKVKIQFWHAMGGDRITLIQNTVNDFMKANPDIEVTVQYVGSYEEILAKTVAALQAGTPPHIVQLNEISTKKMIDSGLIVPVEDLIKKDPTFDKSKLVSQVRNYYSIGGKLYSMPWNSSTPLLFYNKTMFKQAGLDPNKPPKTFSEVIQYSKKLLSKDSKGNITRTGITWNLYSWFFEEWMAEQNKLLVDNNNGRTGPVTKVVFNNDAGLKIFDFWNTLTKEGLMINTKPGDWTAARQLFLSQTVGMLITSTSDVALLLSESKKQGFEIGAAYTPIPDGVQRAGVIPGGGSLWIIKQKNQDEIDASWKLVKYLADVDPQIQWHKGTGYFPVRNDAIDKLQKQDYYKDNPMHYVAIRQLVETIPSYATMGAVVGAFPEIRNAIETAVQKMLNGQLTPQQALEEAEKSANNAIKQYF